LLHELYTLSTQQIYQSNGIQTTFKICGIIQVSSYFILAVVLAVVVEEEVVVQVEVVVDVAVVIVNT
jgi:hypothetical protein